MQNVLTGVVTTILHERGYGFIRDENDHDRFFHANDVRDIQFTELKPRTVVVFEPAENVRFRRQNGRRAENVRILT